MKTFSMRGTIGLAVAGLAALAMGACAPEPSGVDSVQVADPVQQDWRASYSSVTFEEMVDPSYRMDQEVQYTGGICYQTGFSGSPGEKELAILYQDEQSGEAFFAYTPGGNLQEFTKAYTALAAVNCERDFIVYGEKVLDDSGNPEIRIEALEFKMGPERTEVLHF